MFMPNADGKIISYIYAYKFVLCSFLPSFSTGDLTFSFLEWILFNVMQDANI